MCNELAKNSDDEVVLCTLEKLNEKQMLMYRKIKPDVKFISLDKVSNSPAIIWRIFKMLWKEKPDVTHTHLRSQFFAAVPLLLFRKPNIHTIHNLAQKETPKLRRKLYKFLYDHFNFTPVAISDTVLQSMKEEYGEQYTIKIDNGTAPLETTDQLTETKEFIDNLKKDSNTKIFVSIGRLFPQKNQPMLIEAFEKFLAKGYDAHLLIIGAYDVIPEFTEECKSKIETPERIHLLGQKGNVADYLHEADALCFSSIFEGMPIAILEAFSLGVPTVATPVGGMPDIIEEGMSGYLSRDLTSEAYSEALEKIVKENKIDPEHLKKLFNERFTMEKCASDYRELYRKKTGMVS